MELEYNKRYYLSCIDDQIFIFDDEKNGVIKSLSCTQSELNFIPFRQNNYFNGSVLQAGILLDKSKLIIRGITYETLLNTNPPLRSLRYSFHLYIPILCENGDFIGIGEIDINNSLLNKDNIDIDIESTFNILKFIKKSEVLIQTPIYKLLYSLLNDDYKLLLEV